MAPTAAQRAGAPAEPVAPRRATTPDENVIRAWLGGMGAVGVLAAIGLEVAALLMHQSTVTTVYTGAPHLTTTTTTTYPGGPSGALVGWLFAGGVLLVLIAVFYPRITKIVLPGGAELDLASGAQLAAAIAKKNLPPGKAQALFAMAAPRAAGLAAAKTRQATRRRTALYPRRAVAIDGTEAQQLVEETLGDMDGQAGG